MLGGGLERGTNALLVGAAGVGKSSLALSYAVAACNRGEQVAFFVFDENIATLLARGRALGLPMEPWIETGLLHLPPVAPPLPPPGVLNAHVPPDLRAPGGGLAILLSLP